MIVGVDPGIRGSMAFISPDTGLEIVRVPVRVEQRSKREMKFVDTPALFEIMLARRPKIAFVENVFSCPGDTPMTAFSFGNSKGRIETVLEVLHLHPAYNSIAGSNEGSIAGSNEGSISGEKSEPVRIVPVSASVWKAKMGVTCNKATSRAKAEKLYPQHKFASIDDCEAALIATYGMLFCLN